MGELRYSSTILNLFTRWRWVAIFAPRPIYPRGKSPWHPLYISLGGPQSRTEKKKVSCSYRESNPGRPARSRRYTYGAISAPVCYTGWNLNLLNGNEPPCFINARSFCTVREMSIFFGRILILGVTLKCYRCTNMWLESSFKGLYVRDCCNKDHFALMYRRCKLQLSKWPHKAQLVTLLTPELFRSTAIGFASAVQNTVSE
jgi:hypothetical protein